MLKRDFIAFHGYWRESIDDRTPSSRALANSFSLAGNSSNFHALRKLLPDSRELSACWLRHRDITAADN